MSARQTRTRRGAKRPSGRVLLLLASIAAAFMPMPTAGATQTICVALVVDFRPLSGGVDSGCTRVPQGATGYDVLHAGGHTFEICSNGIIGTIDGQPANGCQIKDNTHFWGYWHRKPGSRTWTFSNYGAGVYHPVEGSTEGWVWENGTTSPPADVAYPAGCHSPPASATPSPSSQSTAAATGTPPAARQRSTSSGGSTPSATPLTRLSTSHRRNARAARAAPTATTAAPSTAASATPSTSPTTRVLAVAPSDGNRGGRPVAPVAAGLAMTALLGAGAWWRSRRSGPIS